MLGVARASGQLGIELGVHGDDRVELELEVMDRPEHFGLRTLEAETSETTSGSHPQGIQTQGIQTLRRAIRSSAGSDHSWRSTADGQTFELDRIAGYIQSLVKRRSGMTERKTKPRYVGLGTAASALPPTGHQTKS